VWQKEPIYVSSVSGKKLAYKFPKPWELNLPGGGEAPRANSVLGYGDSSAGSRIRRPASSIGFAQREHSSDWNIAKSRPRTPSIQALAGVKTVIVPHAIPNLNAGLMPTGLEQWPARTTRLMSTDIFQGDGVETGNVVPARGYLNASSRFNVCLQTNTPSALDAASRSSHRPVTTKPSEMAKIEQFIDVEFKKSKLEMDEFNWKRLAIFRRAFDSVVQSFKSWSPLLKTIQREYDTYVTRLEAQSEKVQTLNKQLVDMEIDFSQKFQLMRQETARVVECVQAEADRTVEEAEKSLKAQLDRKEVVEAELDKEKRVVEQLAKKLPEVEFQLQVICVCACLCECVRGYIHIHVLQLMYIMHI